MYYIWRIYLAQVSWLKTCNIWPWHKLFFVAEVSSWSAFLDVVGWSVFYREFCTLAPQEWEFADGSSRHGPGGCGCTPQLQGTLGSSPRSQGRADTQGLMPKEPGGVGRMAPAGKSPESRPSLAGWGFWSRRSLSCLEVKETRF